MKTNQQIAQAIAQKLNSNSGVAQTLTAKNNITLLNTVFSATTLLADKLQSKFKNFRILR